MSLYDDVNREALHDWLDERDALRADEMPDRSEYEDVFLDDERFDDAEWPEDFEAALGALSRAALAPAPRSRKQRDFDPSRGASRAAASTEKEQQ